MSNRTALPTEADARYTYWSDIKRLHFGPAIDNLLFGRRRDSSSVAARRDIFYKLIPKDRPSLEIAPFHNPFLTGPNVKTFDVFDADTLRQRAKDFDLGEATIAKINDVDYVSPSGDLSIITDRFEVVYSSHCAEHTPDIIKHFNQVAELLESGGRYYLFLPDKRYCFDHFRPESSIADVFAAFYEKHEVHTMRNVLEGRFLHTHNKPRQHWRGRHGVRQLDEGEISIKDAVDSFETAAGTYVDTHAWTFTPDSFRWIFQHLAQAGYCKLKPVRVYNTRLNSHEFSVVMEHAEPVDMSVG